MTSPPALPHACLVCVCVGEKSTKIFALDGESGGVKWVNAHPVDPTTDSRLHMVQPHIDTGVIGVSRGLCRAEPCLYWCVVL